MAGDAVAIKAMGMTIDAAIEDDNDLPPALACGVAAQEHDELRFIVSVSETDAWYVSNQVVTIDKERHGCRLLGVFRPVPSVGAGAIDSP